jgi:Ni/Fe-hydrogenase subunit HybB-like protein
LDGPAGDPREESIGDLFGRLVEDGRAYAEAELALIKAIAEYRAQRAGRALAALAAGLFLAVSAATALVVGAVMGLSQYMSPFLAGLLVAAALAAGGYVLVTVGLGGIKGLGRDRAEQEAIDKGAQP